MGGNKTLVKYHKPKNAFRSNSIIGSIIYIINAYAIIRLMEINCQKLVGFLLSGQSQLTFKGNII
jgi:hypothetical protein